MNGGEFSVIEGERRKEVLKLYVTTITPAATYTSHRIWARNMWRERERERKWCYQLCDISVALCSVGNGGRKWLDEGVMSQVGGCNTEQTY